MTLTIALTGQKGGVGKSTVAIAIAAEATSRGSRVLLVDADPQGTARTWGDVAAEAGHPAPSVVAMGAALHRPGQLDRLAAGHDLVVIDCPPRHGEIQRSALLAADLALLPCGPTAADAWALAASLELLESARALRPALRAAIVVTRIQSGTVLGRNVRKALAAAGVPILGTMLRYRVTYQEALAAGQGPSTYAPGSLAASEVRRLFDEITRESEDEAEARNDAPKAPVRAARGSRRG